MTLGPDPAATIDRIGARLAELPGLVGIVLGGSRARGRERPDSDIDIGLYYDSRERPPFSSVLDAAKELDDHGRPAGHGRYGAWGPWIDGGVWLTVDGYRTDFLLRDFTRVGEVLRDAASGVVTTHYQPGHPHGFVSTIYAGEVSHNVSLHDPHGALAELRTLVEPYPPALLRAVVAQFGWEATFSLDNALSPARRGDLHQVTGLLHRALACMNQVVFARNGRYVLNEKGALHEADAMDDRPVDYRIRAEAALGGLSGDAGVLEAAVRALREIRDELPG
ncbi:hypothetical protein JI76_21955 [Streptomyces anulatus]|uniref:nucleotidyltransferase domain-containing protein n=1 Tax=Streptomyces TaxID=1883 RepID=UPI0006DB0B70|nr:MULTISPECIES: nucleotidyltransferase domain-containing protein [Streptomyces]KPL31767.1 hypothetical protein JI76_21955 [Streptomyces anulatus]MBT1098798.1 nucleotidyltransferase domain-containing protein [Streptomyces sp. Tu10]WSC63310.1 nucleotidyltransferase domain-containing protein [Streptomyces anulatus]